MSLEFKCVAQDRASSTIDNSLYALGLEVRQAQVFMKFANVSTSSAKLRVYYDAFGSGFSEDTAIFWDITLRPGETLEVDHIFMNDSSADTGYRTDTANAITATVYAIEDLL